MPKPPKDDAPTKDHKRHADEVLADERHKVKPAREPRNDDVAPFVK